MILAPLAPLAGLLTAWWAAYIFLPEFWIPYVALSGLLLGVTADWLLLKKLVERASRLKTVFWAAVFLFYSTGVFGMFMGVPIFNALLALPAGFVTASKLAEQKANPVSVRRASGRTAWFTSGILLLVCGASAFVALASSSTASDLQGMLGLGFEVTRGMITGLIVLGGLALLGFNWILTFLSSRLAYRLLQRYA